jgi:hypothetical protein
MASTMHMGAWWYGTLQLMIKANTRSDEFKLLTWLASPPSTLAFGDRTQFRSAAYSADKFILFDDLGHSRSQAHREVSRMFSSLRCKGRLLFALSRIQSSRPTHRKSALLKHSKPGRLYNTIQIDLTTRRKLS